MYSRITVSRKINSRGWVFTNTIDKLSWPNQGECFKYSRPPMEKYLHGKGGVKICGSSGMIFVSKWVFTERSSFSAAERRTWNRKKRKFISVTKFNSFNANYAVRWLSGQKTRFIIIASKKINSHPEGCARIQPPAKKKPRRRNDAASRARPTYQGILRRHIFQSNWHSTLSSFRSALASTYLVGLAWGSLRTALVGKQNFRWKWNFGTAMSFLS